MSDSTNTQTMIATVPVMFSRHDIASIMQHHLTEYGFESDIECKFHDNNDVEFYDTAIEQRTIVTPKKLVWMLRAAINTNFLGSYEWMKPEKSAEKYLVCYFNTDGLKKLAEHLEKGQNTNSENVSENISYRSNMIVDGRLVTGIK